MFALVAVARVLPPATGHRPAPDSTAAAVAVAEPLASPAAGRLV